MKLKKILLTALLATPLLGLAQSYPNKPVRIMVGANAGGGTDIIARMLAEKMGEAFKGSFVVENNPGASNTIAADLTAKAPADGHTLLVATNTGQAIAPHLIKLSFDPIKDLTPVGLVVTVPNVLVVGANVPANNVAELVSLMKAKPNEFKYASSGVGSTQHIAGEGFNLAAGVKSIHVPYRDSSQAHLDIIGGNVQIMFDTTSSAMGQIKAGKLRALAFASEQRSPTLPAVPTATEAGLPGFTAYTWVGAMVSAKTPKAEIDKLASLLTAIERLPETREFYERLGAEVMNGGPEEMRTFQAAEIKLWKRIAANAKVEQQ